MSPRVRALPCRRCTWLGAADTCPRWSWLVRLSLRCLQERERPRTPTSPCPSTAARCVSGRCFKGTCFNILISVFLCLSVSFSLFLPPLTRSLRLSYSTLLRQYCISSLKYADVYEAAEHIGGSRPILIILELRRPLGIMAYSVTSTNKPR